MKHKFKIADIVEKMTGTDIKNNDMWYAELDEDHLHLIVGINEDE